MAVNKFRIFSLTLSVIALLLSIASLLLSLGIISFNAGYISDIQWENPSIVSMNKGQSNYIIVHIKNYKSYDLSTIRLLSDDEHIVIVGEEEIIKIVCPSPVARCPFLRYYPHEGGQ